MGPHHLTPKLLELYITQPLSSNPHLNQDQQVQATHLPARAILQLRLLTVQHHLVILRLVLNTHLQARLTALRHQNTVLQALSMVRRVQAIHLLHRATVLQARSILLRVPIIHPRLLLTRHPAHRREMLLITVRVVQTIALQVQAIHQLVHLTRQRVQDIHLLVLITLQPRHITHQQVRSILLAIILPLLATPNGHGNRSQHLHGQRQQSAPPKPAPERPAPTIRATLANTTAGSPNGQRNFSQYQNKRPVQ